MKPEDTVMKRLPDIKFKWDMLDVMLGSQKAKENAEKLKEWGDSIALAQAEISFVSGQENEKAKIRAIYKDANDLKELESRILEYLEFTD